MPCSTFIKQGIFCLIGIAYSYSFGQKTIHKSFIKEGVDQIFVDAKDSFEVVLKTTDSNSLTIKAEIEGEYSPNQLVNVFTDRNLLTIEPSFNAGFVMPNDKLSAHKVLSVSLFIEIPKQFKVKLTGNSTNAEIHGDYKDLRIELNDGNCTLYHVASKVTVHTIKGSINAYVDKATIDAHSTYGTLESDSIPLGTSQLNLKSQIGHIQIIKANK